jgi:peptidoglycan/LPS O-acetylase OafA/YrhL
MFKSLQAGRAVAALLVVLLHLGTAISAEKYFGISAFGVPFSFGHAGVEFFFVLSGFIIVTAHRDDMGKPNRLGSYAWKRLVRIYPIYWVVFLGVFLLALAFSPQGNTVSHDPLVVLQALLLVPQDPSVVGSMGAPLLPVAWTLQYEMLFYSVFGLIIIRRWIGAAVAVILLGVLATCQLSRQCGFPATFLASPYILLFGMGMAAATAHRSRLNVGSPLAVATFGVVVFGFAALAEMLRFGPTGWGSVTYGFGCVFIVVGLTRAETEGQVVGGNRRIQLLGDSSYALYLSHYPLISVLCKAAMALGMPKLGVAGALITYVVILATCIAAGVALHLIIEKPTLSYLRTWRRAPVRQPTG